MKHNQAHARVHVLYKLNLCLGDGMGVEPKP